MAGREIEVDEGGSGERQRVVQEGLGEPPEFEVRGLEGRRGRCSAQEKNAGLRVELDERQSPAASELAENRADPQGCDPGDNHRRAHLENHPDEQEA